MSDQLEQIGPLDRISAGKHEDRHLHVRNLVDKRLSFLGTQFPWITIRLCGGAAVHTGQIASLGHLPNCNEGALVEIDGVNLRVHKAIRLQTNLACSDQSSQLLEFPLCPVS